jgi:hypothetical protein
MSDPNEQSVDDLRQHEQMIREWIAGQYVPTMTPVQLELPLETTE